MPWPLSQDYNETIQLPANSFADPELRGGRAVVNSLGLPMPRSGNFADVYEFEGSSGAKWAVKCFTREVRGLQERYAEISRHLVQARLPFMVDFTYLQEGIRIGGRWYPVLKMKWVDGFLLNEFVRNNLGKPELLEGLFQIWLRMATRLHEARIAHGDLQHGNVILVPGSKAGALGVRLIDYDGMWVPALANNRPGEVGHPSYQHPQRIQQGDYSDRIDRLPLLTIACALRSLVVGGRSLWERYDNGDNLLFRETDLRDPVRSPLFKELWSLPDTTGRALVAHLARSLDSPLDRVPLLGEVVNGNEARPLKPAHEEWVASLLGGDVPRLDRPEEKPETLAELRDIAQETPQVTEEKRARTLLSPAGSSKSWPVRAYAIVGVVAVLVMIVAFALSGRFRSGGSISGQQAQGPAKGIAERRPAVPEPEKKDKRSEPIKIVNSPPSDAPALKSEQSKPAPPPGTVVDATDLLHAETQFDINDPPAPGRPTSRCKNFNVNLTAGVLYQFEIDCPMGSSLKPTLRVKNNTAEGLDLYQSTHPLGVAARIMFRPRVTGAYELVATSSSGALGPFSFTAKPARPYQALLCEYLEASFAFGRAWQSAKTKEEKAAMTSPNPLDFAPKFLEFARNNPKDPTAIEALFWIITYTPLAKDVEREALALLERDHIQSDKLGPVCEKLGHLPVGKEIEDFLGAVLEKSPHAETRGMACLSLARFLGTNAQRWNVRRLRSPQAAVQVKDRSKEVESMFERARTEFGDIRFPLGGTVGEIADRELFEFRFLSPGRIAPEIEGKDQDGVAFKLSDYRGKIVLLDFWGNWAPDCRALYARKRSFLKRFEGKPVVLLGVNSDSSPEVLKDVMDREKIASRSWFDGTLGSGPISAGWHVRQTSMLFLLDQQGILWHKWFGYPPQIIIDQAVNKVLTRAERQPGTKIVKRPAQPRPSIVTPGEPLVLTPESNMGYSMKVDGKMLHLGPIQTRFQLDGQIRSPGGFPGRMTAENQPLPETPGSKGRQGITSVCDMKNLMITQTLEIVATRPHGAYQKPRMDAVLVRYLAENKDSRPHRIGVRVFMDIYLVNNDGALFAAPNKPGQILDGIELKGQDVPDYLQVLERPNRQDPGYVAHFTYRLGSSIEKASRVVLTRLGSSSQDPWNFRAIPAKGDSAIGIFWDAREIPPKGKRVIGYAYGEGICPAP